MLKESPSQFGKILVNLRDVLQTSTEFKDVDVYFNEREINSNTRLPCILLKTGVKTLVNDSPFCKEYDRELEIRLHTKTLDKRELMEELLKYEEDLTHVIDSARLRHDIDVEITEKNESGKFKVLMFNAPREGNRTDMTFFSNVLCIYFNVRYSI